MALDVNQSFIVEAPAGSGKTGLLTQRYLALLAGVEVPESVVAITFTRKAAAEMRERIVTALRAAKSPAADAELNEYERTTLALARRVLVTDEANNWCLLESPNRLRITTIDALCLSISTQLPWVSGFGGRVQPVESSDDYYRTVVFELVDNLSGQTWSAAVRHLLGHLDNDLGRFGNMLVDLLAKRDQWLRYVGGHDDGAARRTTLEAGLKAAMASEMKALARVLTNGVAQAECLDQVATLAAFAGQGLLEEGRDGPLVACVDLRASPGFEIADLAAWRGIADLLLTKDGKWRSRFTRTLGFGPKRDGVAQRKAQMSDLIARLAPMPGVDVALASFRQLPDPVYTDEQWRVLDALLTVLPVAAALLQVEFRGTGKVDFIEVVSAASRALGREEAPSDLALALDYQIQHLLVDEFQDTSHGHEQVLRLLIAGWQPDDGRTLFLVGDPMQSIYRFREADVGVFLRVIQRGLGSIRPRHLQLRANFRARPQLIDWCNAHFPAVLAAEDDAVAGSVSYRHCTGSRDASESARVGLHLFVDDTNATFAEARRVAEVAAAARRRYPAGSIAVLVRSRGSLPEIVAALRERDIPYAAVGVEALADNPAVRDLNVIARALLHPGDRIAWLALLRAPWSGLTLAEIHQLTADRPGAPVWTLISGSERAAALDGAGQARLARVREVMGHALSTAGKRGFRDRVEGAWASLGGPAAQAVNCLAQASEFLDMLEALESDARGIDADLIAAALARRTCDTESSLLRDGPPAEPGEAPGGGVVQLMTIHRAKGLEFDTVIVPALARATRPNLRELLNWSESILPDGRGVLLLAPFPAASGKEGERTSCYEYIRRLRSEQERHEVARLLYVAATRAKEELHLIASAVLSGEATLSRPAAASLAAPLWQVLSDAHRRGELAQADGYRQAPTDRPVSTPSAAAVAQPDYFRFADDWEVPAPQPAMRWRGGDGQELAAEETSEAVDFDWAGYNARQVGTVVHRSLQTVANMGLEAWSAANLVASSDAHDRPRVRSARLTQWRNELSLMGVGAEAVDAACERVANALLGALGDERGRWIISGAHAEAVSEFGLTAILGGKLRRVVIDRTFVDIDGTRWIIDYKTSAHEGGDMTGFLDQEKARYAVQLNTYARLFAGLDSRPIKLGLYFPLLKGWRAWCYAPG